MIHLFSWGNIFVRHDPAIRVGFQTPNHQVIIPWIFSKPYVIIQIPGLQLNNIFPESVLRQLCVSAIHYAYEICTHIYSDGSTASASSVAGVVFPTHGASLHTNVDIVQYQLLQNWWRFKRLCASSTTILQVNESSSATQNQLSALSRLS